MKANKKVLPLLILFLISFSIKAQIYNPVSWTYSQKALPDNVIELSFTATIEPGWHMYSQFLPAGGPIVTSFAFDKNNAVQFVGKVSEPKPTEEFDKNFNMTLKYFSSRVTFKQKVKVNAAKTVLKGTIEYMSCNNSQCTPPQDTEFEFNLKGIAGNASAVSSSVTPGAGNKVTAVSPVNTQSASAQGSANSNKDTAAANAKTISRGQTDTKTDDTETKSLWGWFFLAFLSGLLAILTPCVFPMIPMTVAFFLNETKSKAKARMEGVTYGLSIVLIYTVIGTIVAITLGANFANFLSTHWVPNVLFFLIFMFFAASFFGMFEITLPGWMINKADQQADKGGVAGAFFMAFTLVLVSFSCTGPIVGAILVASAGGKIMMPIIGMLGFSLAFALPFTLFALFPSWLSNLPKSGGWLNSVKVVLGFIELALGLKFLSIADQTYHWHILDREVYLAMWIVIFTLMGFYLLGKLKFAYDSELKHITVPRLILAIITFSFVVYMIPGMFGAPLKVLSGYLPPESSLDFDLTRQIAESGGGNGVASQDKELCETPKFSDFLHLPHNLKGYFDYDQALRCAKQQNKPLFVDFTGWGCVNCREMEANVWSNPEVLKRLRENYIVVALYVDDRKELPESDWVTSTYDGKVKKTVGKKFADFQITRFKVNSQPYYVLLDTKGELLNKPKAYDLNVDNFIKFLDDGLAAFKKESKQ
ncbi:MAG: protein-disulfide reductase DsbD family protein [Bacteroidota bacterium]|nr:protein-disulfide reductase DsbD family protein [Bacteroidota bacterium]